MWKIMILINKKYGFTHFDMVHNIKIGFHLKKKSDPK